MHKIDVFRWFSGQAHSSSQTAPLNFDLFHWPCGQQPPNLLHFQTLHSVVAPPSRLRESCMSVHNYIHSSIQWY